MRLSTRRLYDILGNPWAAFLGAVGSIASIVSLLWYVYEKLEPKQTTFALIVYCALLGIFSAVVVYSIRVRQENRTFRGFIKLLHRTNHEYRDALCGAFRSSLHLSKPDSLAFRQQIERSTIKSICQRLARIYTGFTHSHCTVTVKLITRSNGKPLCETYERSEEYSERDADVHRQFEVNAGTNTAFDTALMYAPGTISHFHSANLRDRETLKRYRNQRDHWHEYYLSTIIVPIRWVNPAKIGGIEPSDDLGFLCVDTLSTNRLNDTWHVELLAAFADQMYNFLSLMRGRYTLTDNSQFSLELLPHNQNVL